ncbi:MAG: hypothetical protein V2A78_00190 [bacterium]
MATKEEKLEKAMSIIGEAMKELTPEENKYLVWLKEQIDEAAEAMGGEEFDHRSEFCYGIITSGEKIHNEKLLKACKNYIEAKEK